MYFIWTLDKAIKEVKKRNKNKLDTCISFLPVKTRNREEVMRNVQVYLKILDRIKTEGLNSEITLKLHQFGVYGNRELMAESVEAVVKYAEKLGNFVWIDMEKEDTVSVTIEIFQKIREKHKNVGICLQTCLKRTEADIKNLLAKRVPLRLVKGFYLPYDIKNWSEVTENFSRLMEILLLGSDRPCIATHDLALVEKAKNIIREKNIANAEIQFFFGVREKLARELVKGGFKTVIYVPFGNIITYLLRGLFTFDNLRNIQRLLRFKKIY